MYIYIYMFIYIYTYIHIYTYIKRCYLYVRSEDAPEIKLVYHPTHYYQAAPTVYCAKPLYRDRLLGSLHPRSDYL